YPTEVHHRLRHRPVGTELHEAGAGGGVCLSRRTPPPCTRSSSARRCSPSRTSAATPTRRCGHGSTLSVVSGTSARSSWTSSTRSRRSKPMPKYEIEHMEHGGWVVDAPSILDAVMQEVDVQEKAVLERVTV